MTATIAQTPLNEVEQLKQQNALLFRRLLVVSRERDELRRQIEVLTSQMEAAQ